MGLTRIAIARPVFMLMLMLAAILMGWLSYNGMRVEQNNQENKDIKKEGRKKN